MTMQPPCYLLDSDSALSLPVRGCYLYDLENCFMRVSEESRCAARELDCFKLVLPRYNGGDLKVSRL
jgi:hypothetical protein